MRVGIDIDGVLYPWDEAARDALQWKFRIERPGPSLYWTWLKDNITRDQWDWLWTEEGQNEAFSQTYRAYPGAAAMVNAILKAGHEVHFVTHRDPRRTAIQTALFLSFHFHAHPWAGVHVVQNRTKKHSLQGWDVFIDDKPETVREMLAWTNAQVFTPARPWNVELGGAAHPRLIRYDDPSAVADWIEAAA